MISNIQASWVKLGRDGVARYLAAAGPRVRQRSTLYGEPDPCQQARSLAAAPSADLILTAPQRRAPVLEGAL